MKEQVCFITPPSPFLLDERVFPALGVLKVAAVVEGLGYGVEHLDLNGVGNYLEVLQSFLYQTTSMTYAITATTPQLPATLKIAQVIKEVRGARVRLILGGPHATLVQAAVRTTNSIRAVESKQRLIKSFDCIVAGDGEGIIGRVLGNRDVHYIDADDPHSPWFLSTEQVGKLPLPARHLIDVASYHYSIDGVKVTPLIGQLGCPFGCQFCAGRDSGMLRRVRLRPVESVIAEMEHLNKEYGFRGFMFFDDELNVNREFLGLLKGIVELQERLGVEFKCRGFIKSELFNEEQARLMDQAGFRRVMCGFESGSDRILKNIKKGATKDDNTRTMELSHKFGLDMKALMSIGHPGESPQTIEDTAEWLLEVKPQDFDVCIISPYPGSPYYDRAVMRAGGSWVFTVEENGDKLWMEDVDYSEVEDFYKGSLEGYKSYVWTEHLSAEEMVRLRDYVERTVRAKLGIPFYQAGASLRFEASMGQLPAHIYRRGGVK